MKLIRKLTSKIVSTTHLKITDHNKRWTNQNGEVQGRYKYNKYDSIDALSIPLEEYPRYRNEFLNQSTNTASRYAGRNESNGRKRARDSTDNDQLDKKGRLTADLHSRNNSSYYETKRNSFPKIDRENRARDDDYHEAKKQRLDDHPLVQYAIKQPSQYSDPNRKILENLFDPEITADGWEKKSDGIEYHTRIRGQMFYEMGNSIDEAREHVAATALKQLCNFKHEAVHWPEQLVTFRLDQQFADKIASMVKSKFNTITECRYKAHKVLAGIVMTNGVSLAKVVAMGTGTKCIPNVNDDEEGVKLHDMHAEVLARRSFVRFIYYQLNSLLKKQSSVFELFEGKEIRLKNGFKFHLVVNTIPCGDARIFSLPGLMHLKRQAKMGSLRMKKIGGTELISENSYRTTSMSCSDKVARWNVLGLQGSHLAKFIKPVYLASIVLGSKYNPIHMYRAIGGRLDNALTDLPNDYCLNKPYFESTSLIEVENIGTPASMEHGICWSDGCGNENEPEVLNLLTGFTIRGEKSIVSKQSFMQMFKSLNQKLPVRSDEGIATYQKVKEKFYSALKQNELGAWEKGIPTTG